MDKSVEQIKYYLFDKKEKIKSEPFSIDWLINGDYDLEFDNDTSLPLKDFLFFKDDYEIRLAASQQQPVNSGDSNDRAEARVAALAQIELFQGDHVEALTDCIVREKHYWQQLRNLKAQPINRWVKLEEAAKAILEEYNDPKVQMYTPIAYFKAFSKLESALEETTEAS